jgi:pimeloyl-ACP methyl ester carboxylesterase
MIAHGRRISSWCRIALLLVLSACHSQRPEPTPPAARRVEDFDGLVDIGPHSLHLRCVGEGAPVVIFDAGMGNDGGIWSRVLPEVGSFTRACAYDRLGLGRSSAAPRKHPLGTMVSELNSLLRTAALGGQYVLVGHSLGGLGVRLYASEHPNEVVGLVLVDATTEEQDSRFWSLLPEAQLREFKTSLEKSPEGFDFDTFVEGMADVRRAKRTLGDMPLVVLTAGKEEAPAPSELDTRLARAWFEMQAELPRLSSNSAHVVTTKSGHYIHMEEPSLVVAAVREVVHASRTSERVDRARVSSESQPKQ